ncbi:hypothetical protein, partial [Pseudoalteromonas sp. BMB]|uniref:hypothetical protein n=1 Tax=Pseudoalteromonas sp. BMB TaxID=1874619 RepID=UPI000A8177EB
QASWNFGEVAIDAFGNALGNSIVGGIQRSEAEINNRNRYIDAMGQKLTADTARKIDGQLATDLNNSLNTTMQGADASVERMMSANNRNQQIDTNAQFAADEARWASRQQGVVDSANGLSTSLSSRARALESRHRNQIAGIQASADAAFAKGVTRGETMYAAGVRNRESIGVDLLKSVDVEGYLAWRESEAVRAQQWRKDNPNWSRFGDDLWDLGQSVVNSSVSIWNTAIDMSSAYRRHDNYTDLTFDLMKSVGSMGADLGKVGIDLLEVGLSATILPIYQELGYLDGGAVELEAGAYYTSSSGLGTGGAATIAFNPNGTGGTAFAHDIGFENFVRKNAFSFDMSLATGDQMRAEDFLNGYVLAGGMDIELPAARSPFLPNSVGVFKGKTYDLDPLQYGVGKNNPAKLDLYGVQMAKSFDLPSFMSSSRKPITGIRNYGVSGHIVRQQSSRNSSWDLGSMGELFYGFQNMHFAQYKWLTK